LVGGGKEVGRMYHFWIVCIHPRLVAPHLRSVVTCSPSSDHIILRCVSGYTHQQPMCPWVTPRRSISDSGRQCRSKGLVPGSATRPDPSSSIIAAL
jgi:hypothetical protein